MESSFFPADMFCTLDRRDNADEEKNGDYDSNAKNPAEDTLDYEKKAWIVRLEIRTDICRDKRQGGRRRDNGDDYYHNDNNDNSDFKFFFFFFFFFHED